jgi:hypothetical protein
MLACAFAGGSGRRPPRITAAFDEVFQAAGVRIVRSAVQAPRMNSIMGAPG